MKKIISATHALPPHPITAGDLAAVDGGAPPARSNHYNGSRENTHNSDVRASSEWRSREENRPSAGFGVFNGKPESPRPQKPPHYIDTNKMEEQASLPPWNIL